MVDKYTTWGELKDNRRFSYGEIWLLRDELIGLLPSDRIEGHRHLYPSRAVVIVQNCDENDDEESVLIRVAPLSSQIKFLGEFDVLLLPGIDGVKTECIAQVQLSQAVIKKDLYRLVGEISDGKKAKIAAATLALLGIEL